MRRLQRFGRRVLHRDMARAWTQWMNALEGLARLQRYLRRALNAGLARAWDSWLEARREREQMQRYMVRARARERSLHTHQFSATRSLDAHASVRACRVLLLPVCNV